MNRYKRQQGMPVTFTLIFLMVLTFILQKTNPQMFMKFFALKSGFVDFYAWQFITYIFLDNISGFSFFFKALIVFMFSSSLEMGWSSGKLLLFFALTVLPKSIIAAAFAFFIPGNLPLELILNGTDGLLNPNSLFLSLMIAYGFLHREEVIYLFFVIPIRIQTLSIISIIFAAIGILGTLATQELPLNIILTIIQLSGYLGILIFSRQIFRLASTNRKYRIFKKRMTKPDKAALEETQRVLEEIIKTTENLTKTKKKAVVQESQLCDPIDFDEEDSYCKNCDNFKRCLERKHSN